MKNKMLTFVIATVLTASAGALWAAAGDAALSGPNGTTTGTPASTAKTKKHHGGHHHKKATTAATPATPAK